MLFLNWYPGLLEPLRSSSLKMMICSKRKTLRSLLRDRTPPSCSQTQKVSCCSSFPWDVSFPWTTDGRKGQSLCPASSCQSLFFVFFHWALCSSYFTAAMAVFFPAELQNKLKTLNVVVATILTIKQLKDAKKHFHIWSIAHIRVD